MPFDTKPLPQIGAGVLELRERFDGNAYRLMYVVALKNAVYVLHAFMKKSKTGIALPKQDADLIAVRLRRARSLDAEDTPCAKFRSTKAAAMCLPTWASHQQKPPS
jgi:phage-related protein